MKSKTVWGLAVIRCVLVGSSTFCAGHEIPFKDLPALVQQTVARYKENGEIKRIEQQTYDGATVYDVRIKRLGPNRELHITSNGAVLENDPNFVANPAPLQTRKLQLSDLPQAVQNTIRSQTGAAAIDDIDEAIFDGRTIYEVEFQRGGQNQEVHIASDGTVFPGRRDLDVAADGLLTAKDGSPVLSTARSSVGAVSQVVEGDRELTFAELPLPIMKTVQSEVGSGRINTIDRKVRHARPLYHVAYSKDGKQLNLFVAENGTVITDESTATTNAAVVQNTHPVSLANASKVTFSELPPAVQNTVRTQAGVAPIEDIDKGILDGRVVYEAAFKKDGRHADLRVAEDGSLVATVAAETSSPQP